MARIVGCLVFAAFVVWMVWSAALTFGLAQALVMWGGAVLVAVTVGWAIGAVLTNEWNPFRGMW